MIYGTWCCNSLLEEGGTIFTFEGSTKRCSYKTAIKVHSPQFYWKVCTFSLSLDGSKIVEYFVTIKCLKLSLVLIAVKSIRQVTTQADLGLADAYINGDFTFVDKDEGLLHLFLVRK